MTTLLKGTVSFPFSIFQGSPLVWRSGGNGLWGEGRTDSIRNTAWEPFITSSPNSSMPPPAHHSRGEDRSVMWAHRAMSGGAANTPRTAKCNVSRAAERLCCAGVEGNSALQSWVLSPTRQSSWKTMLWLDLSRTAKLGLCPWGEILRIGKNIDTTPRVSYFYLHSVPRDCELESLLALTYL